MVRENAAWLKTSGSAQQPFFVYQGLNIVHPDYDTSEEYIARIDQSKIVVRGIRTIAVSERLRVLSSQMILSGGMADP